MINYKELVDEAWEAKKMSYAPYSKFHVGAALLLEDGEVVRGCNIENAAYTPTNCAERTAVFKAISEGKTKFAAIAISGDTKDFLTPCGVCRQVLKEFCEDSFPVIISNVSKEYKVMTLGELLPGGFGKEDLENK